MHGKGYKETPNTGAADLNINNSVAPAASNTSGEDTRFGLTTCFLLGFLFLFLFFFSCSWFKLSTSYPLI